MFSISIPFRIQSSWTMIRMAWYVRIYHEINTIENQLLSFLYYLLLGASKHNCCNHSLFLLTASIARRIYPKKRLRKGKREYLHPVLCDVQSPLAARVVHPNCWLRDFDRRYYYCIRVRENVLKIKKQH